MPPSLTEPARTRPPRRLTVSPRAAALDALPDNMRLRAADVTVLFGISSATLDRRISAGTLPAPEYDGRLRFWRAAPIRTALASSWSRPMGPEAVTKPVGGVGGVSEWVDPVRGLAGAPGADVQAATAVRRAFRPGSDSGAAEGSGFQPSDGAEVSEPQPEPASARNARGSGRRP